MSLADEPVPEGMGEAAFFLMIGLFSRLIAKGVLTKEDAKAIIDEATLGLEEGNALAHPKLKAVHSLLELVWHGASGASDTPHTGP